MVPTSDRVVIEKLNRLIDEHLDQPAFSIDAICQALGISRSHLHRIVKEQTHLSTSLYIRQRRLLKASDLLCSTDWRISEIGDATGFPNPQNFSTYFTEEFRTSPTEYRRQHQSRASATRGFSPEITPSSAVAPRIPAARRMPGPDPLTERPRPQSWPRYRGMVAGLAAGLLLLVGAGWYGWLRPQPQDGASRPTGNSIAVLPFTNLGPADTNPVCDGIVGELHSSVSLLNNLKVIARSSSDQYRNTQKTIWQIGNELNVANILKGSVLKTGEQIQIKVELISAQDDIRLWAKTYRAPYQDFFSLTDQIVRDVAAQLKVADRASASEKLALARTRNLDAYNALLQGRQLLVSRLDDDLMTALVRFDRALALDSTFAEAYALKAAAYHLLRGSGGMDSQKLDRLTEENALTAIRLDPTNSTAYGVLGSLYYSTYQWQASENAFRIALQHNLNDAQAHYWFSLLMRTTGRLNEAVRYSAQAIALDPLHPIMTAGYINNCAVAGRLDMAREGMETAHGLFEKSFAYQAAVAYYWMAQADYNRAAMAYEQALVLNPDDRGQIPILMYCEAKRGNRPRAVRFLRELTATTPRSDYERAVVYAGLDLADSSLYHLKKAADGGYLYRDTKAMTVFRPYHAHPVFRSVLRQFKLPEE